MDTETMFGIIMLSTSVIILCQAIRINHLSREVNAYVHHDIHEEAQVRDCLAASRTLRRMRDDVPESKGERHRFLLFCRDVNTFLKWRRIIRENPDFASRYEQIVLEIEDTLNNSNQNE